MNKIHNSINFDKPEATDSIDSSDSQESFESRFSRITNFIGRTASSIINKPDNFVNSIRSKEAHSDKFWYVVSRVGRIVLRKALVLTSGNGNASLSTGTLFDHLHPATGFDPHLVNEVSQMQADYLRSGVEEGVDTTKAVIDIADEFLPDSIESRIEAFLKIENNKAA